MAHAAARRGRAACDEPSAGLGAAFLGLVLQELCRFFFGGATDFTDHDDRLGFIIAQEHVQHVDMFGALDRVAADANGRRLAQADVGCLLDRLISQRARAGHNTNRPAFVDVSRHDADLAGVRGDDTGAVRPDQARFAVLQRALHFHHVEHRDAFCDADDQLHFSVNGFHDRIRCKRRRHIDHGGIGLGHGLGFVDRVEHWQT